MSLLQIGKHLLQFRHRGHQGLPGQQLSPHFSQGHCPFPAALFQRHRQIEPVSPGPEAGKHRFRTCKFGPDRLLLAQFRQTLAPQFGCRLIRRIPSNRDRPVLPIAQQAGRQAMLDLVGIPAPFLPQIRRLDHCRRFA